MREIGVVIWVVLLIVGVIGSMTSSLRKQRQERATPRPRPRPPLPAALQRLAMQAAPAEPAPATSSRATPSRAAPPSPSRAAGTTPHAPEPAAKPERIGRRLFGNRGDLVRAVIAAEVLGKPRGLSDEYLRNP
jgi:hypothetical protein